MILSPTLDEWSVDAGSFRCIARHLRITRDGGTYYAPGANHPILSRPPPASMCCTACRTRCCCFPIARQALSRFWSRARGGRKGGRAAKAGSCSSLPAPTYENGQADDHLISACMRACVCARTCVRCVWCVYVLRFCSCVSVRDFVSVKFCVCPVSPPPLPPCSLSLFYGFSFRQKSSLPPFAPPSSVHSLPSEI